MKQGSTDKNDTQKEMSTKSILIIVFIALIGIFASWYFSSRYIGQFKVKDDLQQKTSNAIGTVDITEKVSDDIDQKPTEKLPKREMDSQNQELQNY